MVEEADLDLSEIPIRALRDSTKKQLAVSLNGLKIIPTDETNIPRDWRGVAHFAGVSTSELSQSKNPIVDVLTEWNQMKLRFEEKPVSIKELQDIFGWIDRWDTYNDTKDLMLKDAEQYIASLHNQVAENTSQPFQHNCLILEDVERFKEGLPLITYDAFLLYDHGDIEYAKEMIHQLETIYGLRLIVKDRDLLPGIGFEHSAIIRLIAQRCSSIIVILSPNFLANKANMFFLEFAHSFIINNGNSKKIIPCIYESCNLPCELRFLCYLDYHKAIFFGNFWDRIRKSVVASSEVAQTPAQNRSVKHRCIITEVDSEGIQSPIEQTAIVQISDPSTHYPGSNIEDSHDNSWLNHTPSNLIDGDIACQPTKQRGLSWPFKKTKTGRVEEVPHESIKSEKQSNILNVLNKKKNKLFQKKRPVACEA